MEDLPSQAPAHRSSRIVDLVFAGEPAGGRRRLALGSLIVLALYTGVFTTVSRFGHSAGSWSAEMAARVHDAIMIQRAVDVTPPPPAPPSAPESPHVEAPRVARTVRAARARPAPPAQAGQLAAASPEPVDFTGSAFVVGTGTSYAGGTTTSTGTNRTPARGDVSTAGKGDAAVGARSRARPVSLDQSAWNCPWPAEADAEQVNEQTVVLRVAVRADGGAERADVVSDPGLGFGAAARLCALRTRFEPARDAAGAAIAALSPPIRVHFFR
jgi:protein TonB